MTYHCIEINTKSHAPGLYAVLFPGHSHPLVFDYLQYVNMEGEGLGDLVTCSYSRVDTQGAVPDSNNSCFMS